MTIFDRSVDVAALKSQRLLRVARRLFPKDVPEDDYIWQVLLGEEARLQRELRVYFSPVNIVPMNADPSVAAGLIAAGQTVVEEPGYDYTNQFFSGEYWGLIETRQKPIIAVQSITFNYPAPSQSIYTIPIGWVRADKKYGRINLVPVDQSLALPLDSFQLSAISGGRTVPFMIQVQYTAGLTDARNQWPDLVTLIYKRTVLTIIEERYLPQSGSMSIDGISESLSVDVDKYAEGMEKRVESLRQALHGVTMVAL